MRKIAVVSTVGLMYDGITSVLLSYLEAMDRSGMEFYVVSTGKHEREIENKLEALGCSVVRLPSRRENPFRYFWALCRFVRKNRIEVLHAHGNSATLSIEMLAGLLGGCKKRIAHSHNTKCDQVKADKLLRPLFYALYTDAVACGTEAGKWLFANREFTVLRNGRDVSKYSFLPQTRDRMRVRWEIPEGVWAFGHVGGFFEQKNHRFLMRVFREILKKQPSARMFLVGDGPLRGEIEASVSDIREQVCFVGAVDNVPDYLQMLDGMLLPSLFEGLPLVAVEWQINGLPALLADTVTADCRLADTVDFCSLEADPAVWAEEILEKVQKNDRVIASERGIQSVREKGFDIADNAKILRALYLS